MKVILIGPFPPPVTGESIANQELFEQLDSKSIRVRKINTSLKEISSQQGSFSLVKVAKSTMKYFKGFNIYFAEIVYITPGQTFFGILKYLPFILLAKIFLKKVVIHIHGGGLRDTLSKSEGLQKKMITSILSIANAGIVLSASLRDNFEGILASSNVFEVKNFASHDIFHIKFENKSFQELKVLYLSNLMIEKGILDVINAFKSISANNYDIELIIAGNIESSNFEIINKELNASNINYVGPVFGDKKVKLLEDSNVLILPTYYRTEGQPISIIEGMVAGNYILTTAHSGIVDIVSEGKNGSFVEKKSAEGIINTLFKLSQNMKLVEETALYNYKTSRMLYRPERFCNDILEVFRIVLNKY